MKISHKSIDKSTRIPAPFDEFYRIVSENEFAQYAGTDDASSIVEKVPGYDFHHIAWVIPKPEYEEMLADDGLEYIELAQEGDKSPQLVYVVGDRVQTLDEWDLEVAGVYDSEDYDDEDEEMLNSSTDLDTFSDNDNDYNDDYVSDYYVTPEITESDLEFAAQSAAKYLKRRNLDVITTEDVIEELRSMSDMWDLYWAYGLTTTDARKSFLQDFLKRLARYGLVGVVDNTFGENIDSSTSVNAAVDTGLDYWYYSRHGIGPGTIPSGVQVLDWYEEGYKTWMLLDKMLTTAELNDYELKEQFPPEGAVTHNGDEITACNEIEGATAEELQQAMEEYAAKADEVGKQLDDLQEDVLKKSNKLKKPNLFDRLRGKKSTAAATCTKVNEDDNSIEYVISSSDTEDINASADISTIDLDKLKSDIEAGCIKYLCGPEGGFRAPDEDLDSEWDMYATDVFIVEIYKDEEKIVVEVRAEISYDGMVNMADILDDIIVKYDKEAYFEQVEPGIMEAYIRDRRYVDSSTDAGDDTMQISASRFDSYNDKMIARGEDARLNPPDYDDVDSEDDKFLIVDFPFDIEVTVKEDGDWEVTDGDPLYRADSLDDYHISEDKMLEDFLFVLEWHVPDRPGKYAMKGKMYLGYEDVYEGSYGWDNDSSYITDLTVTNVGKVDSSINTVEAAMTEEDLDYAIENNKPFDLESFKKYKHPEDPYAVRAKDVKVGDVISNESDASEINLGTVFKVLAINDPSESWIEYTFRCEIVDTDGSMRGIEVGSIIDLHYDEEDEVGYLVEE